MPIGRQIADVCLDGALVDGVYRGSVRVCQTPEIAVASLHSVKVFAKRQGKSLATCRFCKSEMHSKAVVCATCGRHQRWGSVTWANSVIALLVALLSVGTLVWDRLKPVLAPDRAVVKVELGVLPTVGMVRFFVTNLSEVLVSSPRHAACYAVEPVDFVQKFQFGAKEKRHRALLLEAGSVRSVALGEESVDLSINQFLFPRDVVANAGYRGAMDCVANFSDRIGPVHQAAFRMYFEYVRDQILVTAHTDPDMGPIGDDLDDYAKFARVQVFGCEQPDPDLAKPACP